eukprot:GFUD01071570.1.p1 GENE.GFUD01071570.1~~GFUD01071570.1.p1  ORF type:complete len:128 (+),score=49.04 GFUD01071570.1:33-386(+)
MEGDMTKIASDKCEESEYYSNEEKTVAECEEKPCEEGATIKEKLQINVIMNISKSVELKGNISDEMQPKSPSPMNTVLNLSMTAKEMRDMIESRKKKDPRKENRKDMKKRVEMVETL